MGKVSMLFQSFILWDIKIQMVPDITAKFLVIYPKKENITLMNTRPYSLEIRLVQVSTLRKT